jgi:flagellar basal body rod protein FlgG
MTEIVSIAQAGMLADVERLRAVSQNLANISTLGYKREIVVSRPFMDRLDALSASNTTVPTLSTTTDHSPGSLKFTGNPLDVSVDKNAYFIVRTDSGEALTRQGNFRLDPSGRLVTASGATVVGNEGEIRLTTPNPRIDNDGSIWEGATKVATLRLAYVADPNQLQRLGNGLYLASSSVPASDAATPVRQGYVEAANTVAMDEMIRMIETVRHFEASQRLLRGYDSMLDRAINQLADV